MMNDLILQMDDGSGTEVELRYDPSVSSYVQLSLKDWANDHMPTVGAMLKGQKLVELIEVLEKCERMRKSWEE